MAGVTRKEWKQTTMRLHKLSNYIFLCVFCVFHLEKAADATASSTSGIYANYDNLTPLQKHIAFFDRNKDGRVYPAEAIEGMMAIGFNMDLATYAAGLIVGGLSGATAPPGTIPGLLDPVYVENIKKGIHRSHSGSYDKEGRFVPEKFEEAFAKYGKTKPNALTLLEIDQLIKGNREPNDPMGPLSETVEWKLLYIAARDKKDGFLYKDTARGAFNGSLWDKMAKQRSSRTN
ncbi:hypothetical protein LUZ63_007371 [Rhynchospora breviuscula]|uniref:Caleosin n=1 Tax=Rhynchospora breviuscula TaxID=2022672 RepID=A0A9Q0CRK1_9POAL|nr:hypothetical protein LUZ63_007371 [Rhynchospora breviuscula]